MVWYTCNVPTVSANISLQRILFSLGYNWGVHNMKLSYTDKEWLTIGANDKALYFSSDPHVPNHKILSLREFYDKIGYVDVGVELDARLFTI